MGGGGKEDRHPFANQNRDLLVVTHQCIVSLSVGTFVSRHHQACTLDEQDAKYLMLRTLLKPTTIKTSNRTIKQVEQLRFKTIAIQNPKALLNTEGWLGEPPWETLRVRKAVYKSIDR